MKIAINACFGGFSFSPEATLRLYELGVDIATPVDEYYPPAERAEAAKKWPTIGYERNLTQWREYLASSEKGRNIFLTVFSPDEKFVLGAGREVERHDPRVIQVIEELGDRANGACAALRIVEIPDGTDYEISEYDGIEHIAEKHQTWS